MYTYNAKCFQEEKKKALLAKGNWGIQIYFDNMKKKTHNQQQYANKLKKKKKKSDTNLAKKPERVGVLKLMVKQ